MPTLSDLPFTLVYDRVRNGQQTQEWQCQDYPDLRVRHHKGSFIKKNKIMKYDFTQFFAGKKQYSSLEKAYQGLMKKPRRKQCPTS